MPVVSGTCVLLEISNNVCTKYNEPTLLHATIYICQQDKYKADVCMHRSAICLSKENLYALPWSVLGSLVNDESVSCKITSTSSCTVYQSQ